VNIMVAIWLTKAFLAILASAAANKVVFEYYFAGE